MKVEKARKKVMNICSKQEKCRFDMEQKLIQYGLDDSERSEILDELERENFISHKRYAEFFARDKYKFNQWGKIKISYTLRQKGIEDKFIDQALASIDETEYKKMVTDSLKKKKATLSESDVHKLKSKLVRFGQSRGYEPEIIFHFIEKNLE